MTVQFCPGPFQDAMIDNTFNLMEAGHSFYAASTIIADAFNIDPVHLREWVEWAADRALCEYEVEGA